MKIKLLLISCALLFVNFIYSQEQLNHKKKVYISPEGRLYICKALPVYLWLSTSEDKTSEKYLLKSETVPQYSNPMYFDTEGYNTVRSPSAVDTTTKQTIIPLQDVIFEVYSDSKAPVTKIDFGDTYIYIKAGKNYTKAGIKINFKSFDSQSGVEDIYFSINKEPYKKFISEISLNEQQEYLIKYYSVDHVGNAEIPKEILIITDKTNPKTSVEFKGDFYNDVVSGRAQIEITAEDENEVFATYYQMDSGPKTRYSYPIKMSMYKQGDHILKFYSIDKVRNEEPLNEYKFYIDKTPPTIVEEILGNSFISNGKEYSSGRTKFKITTFDNKAGVKEVFYSINGSEYQLYDKPFYLDNSSGNLKISTYAVDWVNNKSVDDNSQSSTKVDIPYIDLSGPTLDYTFIGPMFLTRDTIFVSNRSKIKLIAKDPESGVNKIEYKLDNSDILEYKDPFSIDNEGVHSIFYTGSDQVNNKNQAEFVVIVDKKGPEIFIRFSVLPLNQKTIDNNKIDVYPEYVVLFLSCTDEFAGYEKMFYSINGQTEKLYTGVISNFQKGKDYNIIVRAFDKLGNETIKDFMFSTSL